MRVMDNNTERRRINFSGRVQGVGFRYQAQYAAINAGVTGWVQNEYDGTVTIGVVLNSGKAFYVLEDGTALPDFDGINITERKIPTDPKERRFRVKY